MAVLAAENLDVGFMAKKRAGLPPVLSNLDFSLEKGELFVLAGPNGGGKTTLLKTAGGLLPPLGGRVLVNGKNAAFMHKREKAAAVSFLFQGQSALWPFTVEEFISQGRFPHRGIFAADEIVDRNAVARAVEAAGLSNYENRVITELSGGEFQRVLVARAMAQEASIILMDEPVNNLDPKYQFIVMDLARGLADAGLAIMMSLHDLSLAKAYADRVALVAGGHIAALGKPAEVLRTEILLDVFDVPADYGKFIVPR